MVLDEHMRLGFGEAAGDLVEEEKPRRGGERAGELQAFPLEQRQRAGAPVGERQEAGVGRGCRRRLSTIVVAPAGGRRRSRATSRFSKTVRFTKGCGI